MKRHFFIVLAALTAALASNASGAEYYVSSIHGQSDGTGSRSKPWSSVASIHNHAFSPGDTIYFERGSSFTGGFLISSSGRGGQPITYTAYGTGPSPKFQQQLHRH